MTLCFLGITITQIIHILPEARACPFGTKNFYVGRSSSWQSVCQWFYTNIHMFWYSHLYVQLRFWPSNINKKKNFQGVSLFNYNLLREGVLRVSFCDQLLSIVHLGSCPQKLVLHKLNSDLMRRILENMFENYSNNVSHRTLLANCQTSTIFGRNDS